MTADPAGLGLRVNPDDPPVTDTHVVHQSTDCASRVWAVARHYPRRVILRALMFVASLAILTACSAATRPAPVAALSTAPSSVAASASASNGASGGKAPTTPTHPPTTSPPPSAARVTGVALPPFTATISGPLTPADVPFTWRPGCPVPPSDLREIRPSFVGFDGLPHTGTIIVKAAVTEGVIKVFRTLYHARFAIRRMEPVDAFHGSDAKSMAADNTSGFNCRYAVANGSPTWSMHAYGEAIDVNTVENPYFEPGHSVQPPAGAAFADRADHRPGMAYPGGALVDAFAAIGWGWGGYWSGPDYQHFSTNGH
jgi:D-alanyl-D-alanine carboxypeptidase-like protein